MSESKDQPRISFSKDKIEPHIKGASGITGTSLRMVEPSSEIDADLCESGNISYNASELLFKNLDALGARLNLNKEITPDLDAALVEDIVPEKTWEDDMLDNLSEEDVIANLNQHLGYNNSKDDSAAIPLSEEQNYLRVTDIPGQNPRLIAQDYPVKPSPSLLGRNSITKDSFCRSCGGQYLATDNFCGGCGYKRT